MPLMQPDALYPDTRGQHIENRRTCCATMRFLLDFELKYLLPHCSDYNSQTDFDRDVQIHLDRMMALEGILADILAESDAIKGS